MKYTIKILAVILIFSLYNCSATKRFSDSKLESFPSETESTKEKPLETKNGTASYYGKKFDGKKTASGDIYNMHGLTASHKTYPMGTTIRVTNKRNGKNVVLKINDRMPIHNKRLIDVSYGAAKELDMIKSGTAKVKIEVLGWGKEK